MTERMKSSGIAARIGVLTVLAVATALPAIAQRYLPGPRVELADTGGVSVRRPLYFNVDPGAQASAMLVERLKGGPEKKGGYRSWFLSLRHHVGYRDIEHVRSEWEPIIRKDKAGWDVTIFDGYLFDGCPGLLIQALPPRANPVGRAAKANYTGLVLRSQGRLFEARLEALDWVIVAAGRNFVLDFLTRGIFREALGPLRIPKGANFGLRLPRDWRVIAGAPPALYTASHPFGARRGTLSVTSLPATTSVADALESVGAGGATQAIAMKDGAKAMRSARVDRRIVAAVQREAGTVVIDATLPDDIDGVTPEELVVRLIRSVKPIDRSALTKRAAALAKTLKKNSSRTKSESDVAIRTIHDLADLFDLGPAKGVVKHGLKATPRVAEAMARALGARADEAARRALAGPIREMTKRKRVASLATILRALGKTGSGTNVVPLERALGHTEAVVVFAATEALGHANDKPKKSFSALVEFWTRLEAWIVERPQMKGEFAYDEIRARIESNLTRMSGGQQFESPDAARTWMGANRRKIGW